MDRCYYKVNFNPSPSYKDSNMATIKKTLLCTFYYANNRITCIRCNMTGKFASIKKYLAKQKANVILSNANANKSSNGYLSIIVMLVFVVVAYALCFNTIVERQQQYNIVNSSHKLLSNYYAECSTDSECEVLESELNFDFKKGMN